MNSLLIRILSGLVATLVALSLFSFIVVKLTNQVRFEHYWSDLAAPPMEYLSSHQILLATTRLPSLSLVAKNQLAIPDLYRDRLNAGQVVFEEQATRFKAWITMPEPGLLLQLDSRKDGEEIYQLYLVLVKTLFEAQGGPSEDLVSELEEVFGIHIDWLEDDALINDPEVLESLASHSEYRKLYGGERFALIRLKSGEVLKLDFGNGFSSLSFFVVLVLCLVSLASLVFLIKLTLERLDRQLRSVETVASRIARGELDARVKHDARSDAVSRLGVAFNSMADHIQRLMYVQKEMIHAVSHELRTPVARIRFGVQMIEDCPDQESVRQQIKGIDGDIQELDELIDEILTYARLEQGGPILAFQDANIMEIVEQVVSEQGSVKPDLEIVSEYKPGSDKWKESEVEARYIHRSIQNLVGNATRYAKSRVKVVCSFDQETCRVDVEDDGSGIPESDWESVFTPFARLDDSRTRSSGGYGLGLSIVRRILYWHGGQAFLGRSDMGGAKFSLVWPRRQQEPSSQA